MKKLYIYALFHANLAFSSVPKKKYPNIIDKCYWPLLELIKDGHKLGFEFPSSTLRIIKEIDASFTRELSKLWQEGKCEVVGSGFNQNISPLIPYEVNIANFKQGMLDYEELLGMRPTLGFINEQTFSGGLPKLYKDAGFKAIMMDWDNAAEYHSYPQELRYRPVIVEGVEGTLMPVIWNSSLNSYKFQRCIYNRMSVAEYIEEVMVHFPFDEDRSIILYGTDLEMFNYRPVTQEESSNEIKKIGDVFNILKNKSGLSFVNPSEILNYFATLDKIKIETPESPIPCKNRDDYNVLRWATSGRDDVWFNTECYKIYNQIKNIKCLSGSSDNSNFEELNVLWGSDLRTKTTNDKHYDGKKKIGEVSGILDKEFEYLCNKIEVEKDFVFLNSRNASWDGEPFEVEFHFAEGVFFDKLSLKLNGKIIPSQVEQLTKYRDGSIRTIFIVCLPSLGPYEIQQGEFITEPKFDAESFSIKAKDRFLDIKTKAVDIRLATATGGDIRSLIFPKIFGSSLIGYLSPLYYDHVGHSNDYYSMGVKVIDPERGVVNDTKPTTFSYDSALAKAPIRIPIICKVTFDLGIVWKKYYIYRDIPRVDLKYSFYLNNIHPDAFRLGITTINPQAFSKPYLKYSTTNGSPYVEEFYVSGKRIAHNQAVGTLSSARCCLGATEGWIDVSDNSKGLAIISNKSELYSVPMVEYEQIKQTYLMRIYNSISESDETGKIFWRGHNDISFTLLAHKNDIPSVRKTASHINNSLVCIHKKRRKGLKPQTVNHRESLCSKLG